MSRLKTLPPTTLFAVATLAPVPVLVLGALFGGPVAWTGLVGMTAFVAVMDLLMRHAARALPPDERGEFPAGEKLSLALAAAQPVLLIVAIYALGRGTGLSAWDHVAVFASVGLWLGQVGNSNAHELIHRSDRALFRLGKWLYISLLFGHHTSAHRRIHHRYVASDHDPNTARQGESFYAFAPRAWEGSFRTGFEIERELLRRQPGRTAPWRHPYAEYIAGALLCLVLATLIGGGWGLVWYLALAGYAQMQLLMSDYVQHYGLLREETGLDRLEPVGPQHSWNAPHRYSSALMLNAPRHSDHHAHPSKPWPALDLAPPDAVPTLPYSLPVMATLALWPRMWRRVMDPRVAEWRLKARRAAA